MKLKPVSEQVVAVMGASSGIGRQTALQMARQGARVVAAARDRDALDFVGRTIPHLRSRSGGAFISISSVEARNWMETRSPFRRLGRAMAHPPRRTDRPEPSQRPA